MNASPSSIPPSARWLGFGGLIPFFALTVLVLVDDGHTQRWSFALLAYGAVITSFVGALHWGFAVLWPQAGAALQLRLLGWSVVPALGAWCALLLPPAVGLPLLAGLLGAHCLFDLALLRHAVLPAWYPRLRAALSVGAIGSLVIAALAR